MSGVIVRMAGKLCLFVLVLLMSGVVHAQTSVEDWAQQEAVSADGTTIAFYVAGERRGKPPLVAVSGGPGSDHRYMRVGGSFDQLAKNRQVITFDQRGTSRSGAVTGEPRLAQWVEDLEAVRAAVNADKIDVFGHSFGGFFTMAYAERYGEHLRSVTFANSTAASIADTKSLLADLFPDRIGDWRRIRAGLPSRFKASAISILSAMEFVDTDQADEYIRAVADFTYNIEVNNALRQDMADMDFAPVVSALSIPVLVLHGRYDPVIAPASAWSLHQQIPGSEIIFMSATGHLPFAERPAEFVRIMEEFLARAEQ